MEKSLSGPYMKLKKVHFMFTFKKIIVSLLIFIILIPLAVVFNYFFISCYSEDHIWPEAKEIPYNRVGLVPGTARYLYGNIKNPYFFHRIDAAVELFNSGKIKYILVSGDNSTKNYNEPLMMKEELLKKGIPENRIFLDYAGFDTYDTVIRSRLIFGLKAVTIISQEFHNERAVFIARKNGIDAIAFNAKDDIGGWFGFKNHFREYLARVKMQFDVNIPGNGPKYLGERITIK